MAMAGPYVAHARPIGRLSGWLASASWTAGQPASRPVDIGPIVGRTLSTPGIDENCNLDFRPNGRSKAGQKETPSGQQAVARNCQLHFDLTAV